jgi:hypothetical protein
MDKTYKTSVFWKTLAFYGVFMVLYFAYKYFPTSLLSLIAGVVESNFQHYKEGFFAYLIVSLIEFAWVRRRITNQEGFIYSRLTATVFLPWIIFLLWYVAPALIERWPNNTFEIIYANIITLLVGMFTVILENSFQHMPYPRSLKMILITLFLVSILLYTVFTFRLPWADVFVEPDWR